MAPAVDISPYRHLWTDAKDWVLYRIATPRGSILVPFNAGTGDALTIEDEEIAHFVAQRMKYAGIPVVDKFAQAE